MLREAIGLGGLLALSCCAVPEQTEELAFFYWRNRFALSPAEVALLDSVHCRTLYVKFLDVGREADGTIRPYALLEVADTVGLSGRTVVPCVFLTNAVFSGLSEGAVDTLARRIARALRDAGQLFPKQEFSEVQLDCDWTASTRDAYFLFLRRLRRYLSAGTEVSATLRLHQYKFPSTTGVPPVDRVLLMLYNTGNIQNPDETNSIFQAADALRYVHGAPKRYPLPMDVALPAFSWTLVYRDGHLWKIAPEGYRPPPYDGEQRVRTEVIDTALLRQAARVASSLAPDGRVAFFRIDSSAVQRYPAFFLREIERAVRSNSRERHP